MNPKTRFACCSGGDDVAMTRREFLGQAGRGIGSVAIASMLGGAGMFAGGVDGVPNLPHFRPRARRPERARWHDAPAAESAAGSAGH